MIALVSAAPDTDAFISGLQIGLSVAFAVVVGLVGIGVLRRMLDV